MKKRIIIIFSLIAVFVAAILILLSFIPGFYTYRFKKTARVDREYIEGDILDKNGNTMYSFSNYYDYEKKCRLVADYEFTLRLRGRANKGGTLNNNSQMGIFSLSADKLDLSYNKENIQMEDIQTDDDREFYSLFSFKGLKKETTELEIKYAYSEDKLFDFKISIEFF